MEFDTKPFFCSLPQRGLIKISGEERFTFLQGLITNDIYKLKEQNCIYGCLLTPQGKFLHDFFITEHDDALWLDCEGGDRALDLKKRLTIYKLRTKVIIQHEENTPVYACLNIDDESSTSYGNTLYKDPRHKAMGYRSYEKPKNLEERDYTYWDSWRIYNTVPDGSRDLTPEFSTIMDNNINTLHGVCFEKGCYVGQELTARMNYRGLAKKRLRTIKRINDTQFIATDKNKDITLRCLNDNELFTDNDKKAGELFSQSSIYGLALLRNVIFEDD